MYHRSPTKKFVQYSIIIVLAAVICVLCLQTQGGQKIVSDLRFPSFSAIEETTLSESGAVTSGDVLEQATSPRAMMLEQRLDYYREHKAELWSGSVL